MRGARRHGVLLVCLLLAAGCLSGQSSVLSGEIAGAVLDAAGRPVASARITVSDPARGATRAALTARDGAFRLLGVPPGSYQLRAEAEGYSAETLVGLPSVVGETTRVEITLQSSAAPSFRAEATARTPVVALEQTQQASVLDQERIANLPINRRNFLDFALMTPAAVASNDLVDDGDYRAPQTPQSGLSLNGNGGRGNTFSLDGVNNDYNSGGVRPAFSQAAVAEFQVNRSTYTAEFGGIGGAINIVSKSGDNEWHGGVFGFLRDRGMQARNFFEGPRKEPYTRAQDGAALGGPLARNRTFFFAALERLDRHETIFVPILQSPSIFSSMTPSQQALATYFAQSGAANLQQIGGLMQQLLVTDNFPNTVKLFDSNSGDFPFSEGATQLSLRLDHRFSDRHTAFLRANLTRDSADNTQFGALVGYSRSRSSRQFDGTLMFDSTWIAGPRWLVESRGGFGYNSYRFQPNDAVGPQIDIYGYGAFGRDFLLPSRNIERNYQWQQTATHFAGAHVLKFGYEFAPVQDAVNQQLLMGGQFGFGAVVPLGSLLDLATGVPNLDQGLAAQLTSMGQAGLAAHLGDQISALESYNLGLPTFYQQGFGDPEWMGWTKRFYGFAQDSYKPLPDWKFDIGVRYELEGRNRFLPTNKKDFAPRLGFAWSPGADRNTVVRGGFGIYYGTTPAFLSYIADHLGQQKISTVLVPIGGFPGINPQTAAPLSSIDIYQTLAAEGVLGKSSITAPELAQFGLFPSPTMPFRLEYAVDRHFANPYAEQASFEIQHAFGQVSVSAAYNFSRGLHGFRALDRNVIQTGVAAGGQPVFGLRDPLVLQDNVYESTANNYYNALVLHAARRFRRGYLFDASYTFSKDIDDVTDFAPDYEPDNQANARAERALSPFYRKHSLVATAVATLPLHARRGCAACRVFGDFTASGIVQASSFRPFNVITGYDSAGDNHTDTHRPYGLGRDAGRGPDFFTTDLRLSRQFPIRERLRIEFTGDLFNALNRTNFRTVNNVVGGTPLALLPSPLTGHAGVPTDPLAFTSAYDPRQFQFGLWARF